MNRAFLLFIFSFLFLSCEKKEINITNVNKIFDYVDFKCNNSFVINDDIIIYEFSVSVLKLSDVEITNLSIQLTGVFGQELDIIYDEIVILSEDCIMNINKYDICNFKIVLPTQKVETEVISNSIGLLNEVRLSIQPIELKFIR